MDRMAMCDYKLSLNLAKVSVIVVEACPLGHRVVDLREENCKVVQVIIVIDAEVKDSSKLGVERSFQLSQLLWRDQVYHRVFWRGRLLWWFLKGYRLDHFHRLDD